MKGFWKWLLDEYGITWNEFDDNYSFDSGQGREIYEEYCEEVEAYEKGQSR